MKKSQKNKAAKNRVKRIISPTIYPIETVSRGNSTVMSTLGTIEQGYTARELLENSSSFRGSEPGIGMSLKVKKRISMGDNLGLGRFNPKNKGY